MIMIKRLLNLSEAKLQRRIIKWIRDNYKCKVVKILKANDNFFPDLLIILCMNECSVTFSIEVKTSRGKLSEGQKTVDKELDELSYPHYIVDNEKDAQNVVKHIYGRLSEAAGEKTTFGTDITGQVLSVDISKGDAND